MARTVIDAAVCLDVLAGKRDTYRKATSTDRLDGIILLNPTNLTDWSQVDSSGTCKKKLQQACEILRSLGAIVVEAPLSDDFIRIDRAKDAADCTMESEFPRDINAYLKTLTQYVF